MYIIRPKWNHKTSRVLAKDLNIQTRRWPSRLKNFRPTWGRDFFLWYPEDAGGQDERYKVLQGFFSRHKAGQRRAIADCGLPVPETMPPVEGQKYVIRPLYHKGGQGYRLADNPDHGVGEYVAPLFPKTHEYRIIFVRGKPIVFMRKHPGEDVGQDQPWNASNAPFKTIKSWGDSRLQRHTTAFRDLSENPVVQAADIVAVDILYDKVKPQYVVCEFNTCPGLDIVDNRAKIVEAIRGAA